GRHVLRLAADLHGVDLAAVRRGTARHQVHDRLVAVRGDADPAPRADERGDHLRALARLARARRALHAEHRALEPLHRAQVGRLERLAVAADRPACCAGDARRAAQQQVAQRGRERAVRGEALGDRLDRLFDHARAAVLELDQADAPRQLAEPRLRELRRRDLEHDPPALLVELGDGDLGVDVLREPAHVALADARVLREVAVLEAVRARDRKRRALGPLEAGQAGEVLEALLLLHAGQLEELPPHGPRLAVVVLEQVREPLLDLPALGVARAHGRVRRDRGEHALGQLAARAPRGLALGLRLGLRILARRRAARLVRDARLRLPRAQPADQLEGRAAVLLVVVADLPEERRRPPVARLARLPPGVVHDHRLHPALHVALARRPMELLHVLERVARLAHPQRVTHDGVETDEDLRAQQLVERRLARREAPREPPQRGDLVAAVVVDVEVREAPAALDQPVEERFEGAP